MKESFEFSWLIPLYEKGANNSALEAVVGCKLWLKIFVLNISRASIKNIIGICLLFQNLIYFL